MIIVALVDARRPIVIVNPRSGGGLSESAWAKLVGPLTEGLGEFDSVFTTAPRDATRLAAEAGLKVVAPHPARTLMILELALR